MWLAIGLITLLGLVFFSIRFRLANRWRGKAANFQNQPYEYQWIYKKNGVSGVLIGISCATDVEFCLKPENQFDRFFKFLGLSKEQQLQNLHFDEKIYVISDDQRLSSVLSHSPSFQKTLLTLFDSSLSGSFRVRKLWCQRGRLWVNIKVQGKQTQERNSEAPIIDKHFVPLLQNCRSSLTQKLPSSDGTSKDFFIFKAAVLVGISTALAIHAGIHLFRISMNDFPVVLHTAKLWQYALVAGGAIWVMLLVVCIAWLGRTSRMHLVLLELFFVASFGAVGSAYVELNDFNAEWSPQTVRHELSKIDHKKTETCGRRYRYTCYYLTLAPLAGQPNALRLNRVDSGLYARFSNGEPVSVPVYAGALGVPWIGEPQPIEK